MVTFMPDLAKFKMTHLEDDDVVLMLKRVYDIAGILGVTVQVVFNGSQLHMQKGFPQYVYNYIKHPPSKTYEDLPWIYEKVNDQWEVGMSLSGGQFRQVSFVNKFATTAGGTHVDYVSEMIVSYVLSLMKKKYKNYEIGEQEVKDQLWVFVSAQIGNPTFDSPNKTTLTTVQEEFGSECVLSDQFFKYVHSSCIMAMVMKQKKACGRTSAGMY
ncbi:hypothetical protein PR202_ga06789 [Eleusine coracana subsp. coracana]|uniref:DNA topoisomerase (ATP-hydrolyzing) n=1 Tax=Eleusine coracana subsp. coracana TaxID=191504 RepID=A0AAV5BY91_ELECO|nr:hypothetical protein PR202_ga06789 [Eleusine coracana subsp. coracana]